MTLPVILPRSANWVPACWYPVSDTSHILWYPSFTPKILPSHGVPPPPLSLMGYLPGTFAFDEGDVTDKSLNSGQRPYVAPVMKVKCCAPASLWFSTELIKSWFIYKMVSRRVDVRFSPQQKYHKSVRVGSFNSLNYSLFAFVYIRLFGPLIF